MTAPTHSRAGSAHTPTPWTYRDVAGAGLQISGTLPVGFELGGGAKVMGEGRTEFMVWTLRDALQVQIADERWVQFSSGSWEAMQKANAAFIVEAVNNYAALQQSCEELGDMVKARDAQLFVAERETAALQARVEELTKTLEPFAEIAKELVPTLTDDYKNTMAWAVPTVGQLREALRALALPLEDRK